MEYYPSKFKILDFIKSVQNDVFVEAEEQKVELEIEIEKSLKNIFPEKRIFRFDMQSVRNKTEKENSLVWLNDADIII